MELLVASFIHHPSDSEIAMPSRTFLFHSLIGMLLTVEGTGGSELSCGSHGDSPSSPFHAGTVSLSTVGPVAS